MAINTPLSSDIYRDEKYVCKLYFVNSYVEKIASYLFFTSNKSLYTFYTRNDRRKTMTFSLSLCYFQKNHSDSFHVGRSQRSDRGARYDEEISLYIPLDT